MTINSIQLFETLMASSSTWL